MMIPLLAKSMKMCPNCRWWSCCIERSSFYVGVFQNVVVLGCVCDKCGWVGCEWVMWQNISCEIQKSKIVVSMDPENRKTKWLLNLVLSSYKNFGSAEFWDNVCIKNSPKLHEVELSWLPVLNPLGCVSKIYWWCHVWNEKFPWKCRLILIWLQFACVFESASWVTTITLGVWGLKLRFDAQSVHI